MSRRKSASEKMLDAIEMKDVEKVASLISSGGVNVRDKLFLHCAARRNLVDIMKLLLDAGADINATNSNRDTACHIAIAANQFDALKLLVERGADLDVVNRTPDSLLSLAISNKDGDRMIVLLLDAGAPLDNLRPAQVLLLVKSVAVIKSLAARNVDVVALKCAFGGTLCHYVAASVTREADLRALFDFCGPDAIDSLGGCEDTPLHQAVSGNNEVALRVLVELGADIDRRDWGGCTPLHASLSLGNGTCTLLMLVLGADVSLVCNKGQTVCHLAAWDKPDALCACLAAGSDLDQQCNNRDTPRRIAERNDVPLPTSDEIDAARRRIAKTRLDLVRNRAAEICIGLQSLRLDALQLCEILMHSFGALGSLIKFHQWWAIAIKVKHYNRKP
jgi:ankyrin repeat protein